MKRHMKTIGHKPAFLSMGLLGYVLTFVPAELTHYTSDNKSLIAARFKE